MFRVDASSARTASLQNLQRRLKRSVSKPDVTHYTQNPSMKLAVFHRPRDFPSGKVPSIAFE